jgi:hypothetical protein
VKTPAKQKQVEHVCHLSQAQAAEQNLTWRRHLRLRQRLHLLLLLLLLRLRGCWLRLWLLHLQLWLLRLRLRLGRLQLLLHCCLHLLLRRRLHLLQLLHERHGRRRQLRHHVGRVLLPCFQVHDPLLCEERYQPVGNT